jgi:hypothetical protein
MFSGVQPKLMTKEFTSEKSTPGDIAKCPYLLAKEELYLVVRRIF